jgi:hypothetical protein
MIGHGPPFNDDEMCEISQARERFRAVVNQGKYYPAEEEAALTFEREGQASTPKAALVNLTPIRVALADLRNAMNQHIDASKKPSSGGKFA